MTTPPTRTKPCRYVPDWGHYLRTHELNCKDTTCEGCSPCLHDDTGNRVRHCTARKSCGQHLSPDHPATCPKCIGRTRADITYISRNSRLLVAAAIEAGGVDTEAAYLAGPAADPFAWTIRTIQQRRAGIPHEQLEETDPHHPLAVLGRWEMMLREHYHHPPTSTSPDPGTPRWTNIVIAAGYLFDRLTEAAQDPGVAWSEMAAEIHACRSHLEDILNTARRPETGAPCPSCAQDPAPALEKVYSHWCERPTCEKVHDTTGNLDRWRCPKCKATWSEKQYREWVADDYLGNAESLTITDIAMIHNIPAGTIRYWASSTSKGGKTIPPRLKSTGRSVDGRKMYSVKDVLRLRRGEKKATA